MRTVAVYLTGSRAQGLDVEGSDYDSLEVFVAPKSYYFGLDNESMSLQKKSGDDDKLTYEFVKYARQLYKGNSTFFNTLWYSPLEEDTLFWPFRMAARDVLRTQKPVRNYLGLANRRFATGKEKGNTKDLSAAFTYYLMASEYCRTGVMHVDRRGTEFYLTERAMKSGEWEAETCVGLVRLAERLASESYEKCALPLEPDFDAFNALVVKTLEKWHLGAFGE
jgi:predicted nucleotidyltransferase